MTNLSSAAKMTTTTVGLAALLLLTACGTDPTAQDTFEDANAEVTTCAAGAYGSFSTCSTPCADLAPVGETNAQCAAMCELNEIGHCNPARVVEIDGHIGVCGSLVGGQAEIRWFPCETE